MAQPLVSPLSHQSSFDWLGRKTSLRGKKTSSSSSKLVPSGPSPSSLPASALPDDDYIPYRGRLSIPSPHQLPSLLPPPPPPPPSSFPQASSNSPTRRATINFQSSSPRSPYQQQMYTPPPPINPRLFPLSGGIGESPSSSSFAFQQQQQQQHQHQAKRSTGGGSDGRSSVETTASSSARKAKGSSELSSSLPPRAAGGRDRSNSSTTSIPKHISDPLRAPSPLFSFNPSRPPPPQPSSSPQRSKHLQPSRLPFSSSSPDLRSLSHAQHHHHAPLSTDKQSRSRQLAYEASTMCDTFVYPQPKLRPFLVTPPSSPPAAPVPSSEPHQPPSRRTSPSPVKKEHHTLLSRLPSLTSPHRSNRRPSLPAAFVTSDESSDIRVLREGDEREQEKVQWAAAARKGSISRAASTLGGGKGRNRSGSGASRGELGASMGTSNSTTRGVKLSFDFLSKPPSDGRSSAPLEAQEQAARPRKASSQGDLRAVGSSSRGRDSSGGGGGLDPRISAEHQHEQPYATTTHHHPFLGRPLPPSPSVVDIGPDGIWNELDTPASSFLPENSEPTRFVIGQALSPETVLDSSASSSNDSQDPRTHRRYPSQASRSISSLDAFHARFPPSPSRPESFKKSHSRANTLSSSSRVGVPSSQDQSIALPLTSAPPFLENRSWIRESQDAPINLSEDPSRRGISQEQEYLRKVASASSMRVHPSTSGKTIAESWSFPPSPANTESIDPSPELAQHRESSSSHHAAAPSSVGSRYSEQAAPLFSYDNYETLFYEPPTSPVRVHAPPPSSDGEGETWSETGFGEEIFQSDAPDGRLPILRTVSRTLSVSSPDSDHRFSRLSVHSVAGELGDLSASFPFPPRPSISAASGPSLSSASFVTTASFVTAESHITITPTPTP